MHNAVRVKYGKVGLKVPEFTTNYYLSPSSRIIGNARRDECEVS
jgi:hypothetical protein